MILFIVYFILLFFVSIWDSFKLKNFNDFVAAGKRQKTFFVTCSLMATILGASSTLGVATTAAKIGGPAFWWLSLGALGLIFQSLFLSKRIRELNVSTLPEMAEVLVGSFGRRLVALTIAISWIGIIAAQFIAASEFLMMIFNISSREIAVLIAGIVVLFYTLLGGQLSVVRTDAMQFIILAIGILGAFFYFLLSANSPLNLHTQEAIPSHIFSLFNESFSSADFFLLLFTVGGAHLFGPDIISRNLLSKDAFTAKKSAMISGVMLLFFAFIITYLGIFSSHYFGDNANPLLQLAEKLPTALSLILLLSLLSAILSSADTCLINSSAIFCNDLLKKTEVRIVRFVTFFVGVLSIFFALQMQNIISLLLSAYSIYAPGIVPPLVVALIAHKKFEIKKKLWYSAIILGGAFGVIKTIFPELPQFLPVIGTGTSLIMALISLKKRIIPLTNKKD